MTRKSQSVSPASIDPLLPMPAVMDLTSFSKATVYRKVADGSFPKPLKIGQSRVAWRKSDIAEWMAMQMPIAHHSSQLEGR